MAHTSSLEPREISIQGRIAEARHDRVDLGSNKANKIDQLETNTNQDAAKFNQDAAKFNQDAKQLSPGTEAPLLNREEAKTVVSRFTSADLSSSRETAIIKQHHIRDRCKVVSMSYLLLGIGYILPWVVFTTAMPFYTEFKLSWLSPTLANDEGLLGRLHEYKDFFIRNS